MLNNEFAKCSNGKQKRDLLFVEDVASGFVSILENKITGIVNIGSGEGIALKNVIKTIGDKIGRSNLIHCDLKPENILVAENVINVKLIDFGNATFHGH